MVFSQLFSGPTLLVQHQHGVCDPFHVHMGRHRVEHIRGEGSIDFDRYICVATALLLSTYVSIQAYKSVIDPFSKAAIVCA